MEIAFPHLVAATVGDLQRTNFARPPRFRDFRQAREIDECVQERRWNFRGIALSIARLAQTQQTRFDAAVLDVTMPGMSGHELLKALRLLDPELPIVILTGRPEDQVIYRSVSLGWQDRERCDGISD